MSESDCEQHIVKSIKAAAQDKSWRVRYMLGDKFVKLQQAVGPKITMGELVAAFQVIQLFIVFKMVYLGMAW